MATATSSRFLAPLRFSTDIASSRTTSTRRSVPILRILSCRCFVASRSEVYLVPGQFPRPPPRRWNALRDKASWLVVQRQEPEISGALGASRSGNVASESELDVQKGVTGVAEEITSCGTRAGPPFSVDEGPEGNVTSVEVNKDGIINRRDALEGERVDSGFVLSCARGMAIGLQSGEPVATKMDSLVLNEEILVAQRNVASFGRLAWSSFAALCGVCLVLAVSKLIQGNSKAHLLRRLLYMHKHGMERDGFTKGNITMLKNAHGFPSGLLRRPHLDRKELMNNIKRAKESSEGYILRNPFSCITATNGNDASITKIRTTVTEVQTLKGVLEQSSAHEKNGIVCPHQIDAGDEEVSLINNQYAFDNVSDTSLSNDKIEETVEEIVDMKNRTAVMSSSVKDVDNIEEIELLEPTYNDDRTYVINISAKESQIGSGKDHSMGPTSISTISCELEIKEECLEIYTNNLDGFQGTKLSVPSINDQQVIYATDNAHEFSMDSVSEPVHGLSSDCFLMPSSQLRNNETPMDTCLSDVNGIQEVEASRTSVNHVQTAHCKEFVYNMSIVVEDASKNLKMSNNATLPKRSREELIDLKRDNMLSAQEPEPSISTWNDKLLSDVNERDHKERTMQHETQARMETENSGILDSAMTSSLYAPKAESIKHKCPEVSTSAKKKERRVSSYKKVRAYVSRNKAKLPKDLGSNTEAEAKQSEQVIPRIKTVNDPSNCVPKKKRVAKKGPKKVQNDTLRVATQDGIQNSSMVVQENNSQKAKMKKKTNLKNSFHNQGAQTRNENPETAHVVNARYISLTDSMKPLGAASSSEKQSSKEPVSEEQSNVCSVTVMRLVDSKVTFPKMQKGEENCSRT